MTKKKKKRRRIQTLEQLNGKAGDTQMPAIMSCRGIEEGARTKDSHRMSQNQPNARQFIATLLLSGCPAFLPFRFCWQLPHWAEREGASDTAGPQSITGWHLKVSSLSVLGESRQALYLSTVLGKAKHQWLRLGMSLHC